jgi:hypothetical protein
MHNGRVLKIPLTEAETTQVAKRRHNIIHGTLEQIASIDVRVQTFMNSKARIPAMITHTFADPQHFLHLLGNPELVPIENILPEDTPEKRWGGARFVYSQDKVEIVRGLLEYLGSQESITASDRRKFLQLVKNYAQHVYTIWEYGYSDYIFKLGDMGIRDDGSLVTVDLGEFSSDPQFIERAIVEKWWCDNTNPLKNDFPKMHPDLVADYLQIMDSHFTVDEFRARWRQKHTCSACTPESSTISAFIATKVMEIDYVDRL